MCGICGINILFQRGFPFSVNFTLSYVQLREIRAATCSLPTDIPLLLNLCREPDTQLWREPWSERRRWRQLPVSTFTIKGERALASGTLNGWSVLLRIKQENPEHDEYTVWEVCVLNKTTTNCLICLLCSFQSAFIRSETFYFVKRET